MILPLVALGLALLSDSSTDGAAGQAQFFDEVLPEIVDTAADAAHVLAMGDHARAMHLLKSEIGLFGDLVDLLAEAGLPDALREVEALELLASQTLHEMHASSVRRRGEEFLPRFEDLEQRTASLPDQIRGEADRAGRRITLQDRVDAVRKKTVFASLDPSRAILYFDLHMEMENVREDAASDDEDEDDGRRELARSLLADPERQRALFDRAMAELVKMFGEFWNEGYDTDGDLVCKIGVETRSQVARIWETVVAHRTGGDDVVGLSAPYMEARNFSLYPQGVVGTKYTANGPDGGIDDWLDGMLETDLSPNERMSRGTLDRLVKGEAESLGLSDWSDAGATHEMLLAEEIWSNEVRDALYEAVRRFPPTLRMPGAPTSAVDQDVSSLMDHRGGGDASYNLFMTIEGHGIGIWDGRWNRWWADGSVSDGGAVHDFLAERLEAAHAAFKSTLEDTANFTGGAPADE